MTRREQARKMFLDGYGYNDIAKKLNMSWCQARVHGDPDGDWRVPPAPKVCTRCGEMKPPEMFGKNNTRPDRHEPRCLECAMHYEHFRRKVKASKPKPKPPKIPNTLYLCPYCNMPRQGHLDRPRYGHYFESQAEADECCKQSGPGYRRVGCRPTPGKYNRPVRTTLNKRTADYKYHVKATPGFNAARLFGSALRE